MADGIDIRINDYVHKSISDELNKISVSALAADKSIEQLIGRIGKLNQAKVSVASGILGDIGGKSSTKAASSVVNKSGAVKSDTAKYIAIEKRAIDDWNNYLVKASGTVNENKRKLYTGESAFVTAQRALRKQQSEITRVFEDGYKEREKLVARSNARLIKEIDAVGAKRAPTKQRDFNDLLGVTKATGGVRQQATAVAQLHQEYNKLFNALPTYQKAASAVGTGVYSNLLTAQKAYNVQSAQLASQQAAQQLAIAKQSAASIQAVEAANMRARLSPKGVNSLLGVTNEPSKAAHNRQQAALNTAFNAVPVPKMPTTGLAAYAKAVTDSTKQTSALTSAMQSLHVNGSILQSDALKWTKVMWGLAGATLTATALIDSVDTYDRLQNKLKVVSEDQATVNVLTEESFRIANAARQPVEDVGKAYARFDLALQQTGRSQKESLELTETVAKALKLGGANAGEAASALLQLSQAFNKGKADGDEFRSLMENSPVLADAFAKKLGVARGDLLNLASTGKITLQIMADAIKEAGGDIDKAFEKLKITVADSFTIFKNNLTKFFGEFDKQTGITTGMANAIMFLSKHIDVLVAGFTALVPIMAIFVGTKIIAGIMAFSGYTMRAAAAIGAMRNPLMMVSTGIVAMTTAGVRAGATLAAVFSSSTTRAIGLRMAVLNVTTALLAMGPAGAKAFSSLFSIGNLATILLSLGLLVYAFGDRWVVVAETGETAKDKMMAGLSEFGGFAGYIFDNVYDTAKTAFGGVVKEGDTTSSRLGEIFNTLGAIAAATVGSIASLTMAVLGVMNVLVLGTIQGWMNILQGADNVAEHIANEAGNYDRKAAAWIDKTTGTDYAGRYIKWLQDKNGRTEERRNNPRYNEISTFMLDNNEKIAAAVQGENSLLEQSMRNFETYQARTKEISEAAAKARKEQEAKDKAAREKLERERKKMLKDAANGGKGSKATTGKDKKPKKTRQELIDEVIKDEEREIESATKLNDVKEQLAVTNKLNDKLAKEGYKELIEKEATYIAQLVQRREQEKRVGSEMQKIHDAMDDTQAYEKYNAAVDAAIRMRDSGKISQAHAAFLIEREEEALARTTKATYEYTKALEDAKKTLGLYGADLAAYNAVEKAMADARANSRPPLDEKDVQVIQDAARALYYFNLENAAYLALKDEFIGASEKNTASFEALNRALADGIITMDTYQKKLYALKASQGAINEQMYGITDVTEPFRRGLYQFAAEVPALGQVIADTLQSSIGTAIDSLSTNITDMITDWDAWSQAAEDAVGRPLSTIEKMRYMLGEIVIQIGKEMLNAIIKVGIQMMIESAMRRTMAATESAAILAQNATTAAALFAMYAPAAMVVNTATMGGASAAGSVGAQVAMAALKSMGSIMTFADGSDVIKGAGTGRSDSILARISAGEMVMNQEAVRNNYPMLKAMQTGASVGTGGNITNITVIVNSDGTKTTTKTQGQDTQFGQALADAVAMEVAQQLRDRQQQGHDLYSN